MPVDIILLDLGLPDAQGLGAVRRAHVAAPRIPLVVLTGLDDESLAAQALQEGAQDYLVKGQIETPRPAAGPALCHRAQDTWKRRCSSKRSAPKSRSIASAMPSSARTSRETSPSSICVAEKMTGWSRQEAAGRPMSEVFRILDATQSRDRSLNPWRCCRRRSRTVHLPSNCILIRRDGFEIPIEDCVAPIHDREGRPPER